jgi:hypothetical protein
MDASFLTLPQVVVVNQVLACNATLGYEEIFNVQVSTAQHSTAPQPSMVPAWCQALQR